MSKEKDISLLSPPPEIIITSSGEPSRSQVSRPAILILALLIAPLLIEQANMSTSITRAGAPPKTPVILEGESYNNLFIVLKGKENSL